MSMPKAIVVPATKKHTATIICVHGLGDSGAGWSWLAENWRRRGKFEDVTFIFPSAPQIPITVNMGMRMPGWYDITSFDALTRSEDEPGILRSRTYLHSLINQHIKDGIHPHRIILGGFSQGGAMSLFSGLTFPDKRLGGVFGLSCYALIPKKFDELRAENEKNATEDLKPPVYMGHGTEDPLIALKYAKETSEQLKRKGFEVIFEEYPVEHSVDPREIDQLEAWVKKRLDEGAKSIAEGVTGATASGSKSDNPAL